MCKFLSKIGWIYIFLRTNYYCIFIYYWFLAFTILNGFYYLCNQKFLIWNWLQYQIIAVYICWDQFIISFKDKNIIYFCLWGGGNDHFHKRRKDSVLSLLVGFLLFTFDLDIGGYVPVLLHMPKRIGSGVNISRSAIFSCRD